MGITIFGGGQGPPWGEVVGSAVAAVFFRAEVVEDRAGFPRVEAAVTWVVQVCCWAVAGAVMGPLQSRPASFFVVG